MNVPQEPIAIIGMACRWPGDIDSVSSLWKLLMEKRTSQTAEVPPSRFNIYAHYHKNNLRPGSFNSLGGYFLSGNPEDFDPSFFGMGAIEATWMDPQHRKFLEVVYECFESAGVTIEETSGSDTGCFVGTFTTDFQQITLREPDFRHTYTASGVDPCLLSNRVSHAFSLCGPSMTLNTACSSSLYALHVACNALRSRDCKAAIVGGSNLILTVDQQMNTAKLGVLSPTSTCHTFDASADGYGRAEGVGALLLKPLTDAVRDGDRIRAVIRGSAINSNEKTAGYGITHPNRDGQERVIQAAYYNAGELDPLETGYFECHGTGTFVGDPIEVEAVSRAMNRSRTSKDGPLLIGAVKTNLGHSETASGIAAVMKAAMIVETGIIPPTVGFVTPNPGIDFESWKVKVVEDVTPFPQSLPVRRVGVNSFGYGGTNAHVIIEAAESAIRALGRGVLTTVRGDSGNPAHQSLGLRTLPPVGQLFRPCWVAFRMLQAVRDRRPARIAGGRRDNLKKHQQLLVFSAHDVKTLRSNLREYRAVIGNYDPLDLAYTLINKRSRFSKGAYTMIRSGEDDPLSSFDSNLTLIDRIDNRQRVAFIFTGQGAQWPGMGADLMDSFPSFLETIRDIDATLRGLPNGPDWSIESVLRSPSTTSQINEPEVSQPACTALQIALVDLFRRWGVNPVATVGHSSGEIAAAYAAGYITAAQAIITAWARGRVVSQRQRDGAMLAVGLGADDVEPYIPSYTSDIVVACHNSPHGATLSGNRPIIEQVEVELKKVAIFARALRTGGKAYHSPHMQEFAGDYRLLLEKSLRQYQNPRSKLTAAHEPAMFSSVTARKMEAGLDLGIEYWIKNLTQPVLFHQALRSMIMSEMKANPQADIQLVEIGPHSALADPIRDIRSTYGFNSVHYLPTARRGTNSATAFLKACGTLYLSGYDIDRDVMSSIEEVSSDRSMAIVRRRGKFLPDLPRYQWNYDKLLWTESRMSKELRHQQFPRHDVLGRIVPGCSGTQPVWRNVLRHQDLAWLGGHKLGPNSVFPATGYWMMAMQALKHCIISDNQLPSSYTIRGVSIHSALIIPEDSDGIEVLLNLRRNNSGKWSDFVISSFLNAAWTTHCTGTIAADIHDRVPVHKLDPMRHQYGGRYWYNVFSDVGFHYGEDFQNLQAIETSPDRYEATALLRQPTPNSKAEGESDYVVHPAVCDAALQLILVAIHAGRAKDFHFPFVPVYAEEVTVWEQSAPTETPRSRNANSWTHQRGLRSVLTSGQILSGSGAVTVDIKGLVCVAYEAAIPEEVVQETEVPNDEFLCVSWKPDISSLGSVQAGNLTANMDSLTQVVWLLELLSHKRWDMKVLHLNGEELAPSILQKFTGRYREYTIISESVGGDDFNMAYLKDRPNVHRVSRTSALDAQALPEQRYDLILAMSKDLRSNCDTLHGAILPGGHLFLIESSDVPTTNLDPDLKSLEFQEQFVIPYGRFYTQRSNDSDGAEGLHPLAKVERQPLKDVVLVYGNDRPAIVNILERRYSAEGWGVQAIKLGEENLTTASQIIMLVETEAPVLSNLDESAFLSIQYFMSRCFSLLWVTNGALLSQGCNVSPRAEYAMASGLIRSVVGEQPSLNAATIDFDFRDDLLDDIAQKIMDRVSKQASSSLGNDTEREIAVDNGGVQHISRVIPHVTMIEQSIQARRVSKVEISYAPGTRLAGMIDTSGAKAAVGFRKATGVPTDLIGDEVEVQVAAIGLNHQAFDVAIGSSREKEMVYEFSGKITKVGVNCKTFQQNDRVLGVARGDFSTHITISAALCSKPEGPDNHVEAASSQLMYLETLYALEDLARVTKNDKVLVMSNMLLARPMIQVAQSLGAQVYATYTSPSERQYLRDIFKLPVESVLDVTDRALSRAAKEATNERGMDVIVTTSSAEELPEISLGLAPLGRLVAIGNTPPEKQKRSANFSTSGSSLLSLDWHSLFKYNPILFARLLERAASFRHRHKDLQLPPPSVFGIDDIPGAFDHFSKSGYQSRVVISYDNTELRTLKVFREHAPDIFDRNAFYMLIGCLGGLGRSLTTWMIRNGARKLAFLSRSGTDNPAAAKLVRDIESLGVEALIFRGDVSQLEDVKAMVNATSAKAPIKGVFNAAMVLRDRLFGQMNVTEWCSVTLPKVQGSLNLHQALSSHALDFFIMTSSTSGVLGGPGQANYASANNFLDYFAEQRRAMGLPATSLVLPMILGIGVVSQNPALERSLDAKGFYGIDEDELLNAFELAVDAAGTGSPAHGIVGLRPARFAKAYRGGSKANPIWMNDPRCSFIRTTVDDLRSRAGAGKGPLPGSALEVLKSIQDEEEAVRFINGHISLKMSSMLIIPVENILPERAMDQYGLDSTIGTEFRNWIYGTFGVEVSYIEIIGAGMTLRKLCERVYQDVEHEGEQ